MSYGIFISGYEEQSKKDEEDDYIPTWKESQDRLGLFQKASHIYAHCMITFMLT